MGVRVIVLVIDDSTELRAADSELMTLLIEEIAVLTLGVPAVTGPLSVLVMVVKSLLITLVRVDAGLVIVETSLLSTLVIVVRPLLAGIVVVETPLVGPPTTP